MSNLPNLPQRNKKKEADFGLVLRRWIEKNPYMTCSFETKYAKNNSILFSEVGDRQLAYAYAIRNDNKGVLIRVQGLDGQPDYVYLRHEPSYICIKYKSCFVLIDPETWELESKRSKRRSLTESRAEAISCLTIKYKIKKLG